MRYEVTCWAVFGWRHLIPVQPVNCLSPLKARKALMSSWSCSGFFSPYLKSLTRIELIITRAV